MKSTSVQNLADLADVLPVSIALGGKTGDADGHAMVASLTCMCMPSLICLLTGTHAHRKVPAHCGVGAAGHAVHSVRQTRDSEVLLQNIST